mgnify:CR=1 FL=1
MDEISEHEIRKFSENVFLQVDEDFEGMDDENGEHVERQWFDITVQQFMPATGAWATCMQPLHFGYQHGVDRGLEQLRETFVGNVKALLESKGVKVV